jgi:SAM-dependent methyltransferase
MDSLPTGARRASGDTRATHSLIRVLDHAVRWGPSLDTSVQVCYSRTMEKRASGGSTAGRPYDTFSNGYDRFLYPLERLALDRVRLWLIPLARGCILELGVGTGVNLPLYRPDSCVVGLDLRERPLQRARQRAGDSCIALLQADAARIPFGDDQFDTVLSTLLYCSLDNPEATLCEVRRVLRPTGQLLMLEHVRGRPPFMGPLTELANIPWHAVTRSCRLNRQPGRDLPAAGFEVLDETRHALTILQTIVARPIR